MELNYFQMKWLFKKPSHWNGEMSCPTLSEGLGHVIRWKRSLVSSILQGQGSSIGQNQGQYHRCMEKASLSPKLGCTSIIYDYPLSTPSPVHTVTQKTVLVMTYFEKNNVLQVNL
jgi:hypothetical protein